MSDYLLDFIHLVYSPHRIQYFNIQPVSSKLVYFLITLVYKSHKCGYATAIPKIVPIGIMPSHIELEIYTNASSDSSNSSVRII